uniref:(northern house mosquito) hypothetical protein n=2 Tax=Culex pipiens TaxID=7175 RepID=A0A8D8DNY4_CULPI
MMKIVSTAIYRFFGFVYAVAGLIGCVLLLVFKNDLSSDSRERNAILHFACSGLFFYVVLILGLIMRNEKLIKAHLIYMDVMCLVHVVGIIWAGYASSEKVRQNNEEANFLSLPEKIALENKVISNIEASVTWTLVYIATTNVIVFVIFRNVIKSIKKTEQQQLDVIISYV